MCGRFIQVSNPDKIRFNLRPRVPNEVREGFRPRYNIAPTQNILTVLNTGCPRWSLRDGAHPVVTRTRHRTRMINARGETLLEELLQPFRRRRCIIFSDGFYEWGHRAGAGPRSSYG